jgi:hypothetical protein
MTGVVLALAGLTCGDGGPGMGAARESLARSFAGLWEGAWCFRSQEGRAELRDGRLHIYEDSEAQTFETTIDGRRGLRMTDGRGCNWAGTFRLEGDRITILVRPTFPLPCCPGDRALRITLKSAAPRKP